MKKYFCKYLPIEGEIKQYDWLVDKERNTYHQVTCFDTGANYKAMNQASHLQKVKLFLCSSDIQVGDTARSFKFSDKEFVISKIEMGSGEHGFPKEMLVWNYRNGVNLWSTVPEVFKVVGEISPDALSYVKEGDEFDEEQLELHSEYGGPYDNKWLANIEAFKKNNCNEVNIQVKGPCNHFH